MTNTMNRVTDARTTRFSDVWTEPRLAILRQDFAEEMSYARIANDINQKTGSTFTRNACIGKAARIGLKPSKSRARYRAADKGATMPRPKRVARAPHVRRNGNGFVEVERDHAHEIASLQQLEQQALPKGFLGISFFDLQDQHCRYPRDVDGVTLYCGQPKLSEVVDGVRRFVSSYCLACHRRCHNPHAWPRRIPGESKRPAPLLRLGGRNFDDGAEASA